jgi:hypothetical protein
MVNSSLLLTSGLAILNNALVYNYIKRLILTNCECSLDWRREAIILMTVFNFFTILVAIYNFGKYIPPSYIWFLSIYSMLYFITVLSYTQTLKDKDCRCADALDGDVIYYSRAIIFMLILFMLSYATLARFFIK